MDLERYDQLLRRASAYHEAGHAVALLKENLEMTRGISIVPIGASRGRTDTSFDLEGDKFIAKEMLGCRGFDSRSFLGTRVIVLLAGRAAERRLYNCNSGFDSAARGDLKEARAYVDEMASDQKEKRSVMRELAARSRRLVETNWPFIEAVAEALLLEEEMDRYRFMDIVEDMEVSNWQIDL